ncbi:hypothetical protein MYX77_00990 [Acidobacteriia bacterium AH_259_A11_L15]|nr:hypothetical protein [Acidobacteriia bacterium AH_259_A11_L15]
MKTQNSISIEGQRFHVRDRVQIEYPSGKFPPYEGTIRAIGKYGGLPAMNIDGMILTWEMFFFMKRLPRQRRVM